VLWTKNVLDCGSISLRLELIYLITGRGILVVERDRGGKSQPRRSEFVYDLITIYVAMAPQILADSVQPS
jgi:hypothetical protein